MCGDWRRLNGHDDSCWSCMKTIGILQPSFLPWIGYFEQILKSDIFVLYDDVQFEKNSWRNRNRIKTSNGMQWLSVPVLTAGKGAQNINQIMIDVSSQWRRKHVNAITLNYSRAPYFKLYSEELFSILMDAKREKLCDLNVALILWLCAKMGITTQVVSSSTLGISGAGVERLLCIIKHLEGDVFYEGSAGRDYINESDFSEAGIELKYQDYVHPEYPQLYGGFVPYLSAIDLLFNCGTKSIDVLISNSGKD